MKVKRRLLEAGALIGGLLMLLPVVAVAVGLRDAFATLGATGIGDPRSLAGSVGEMRIFTLLFLPLFLGGAALLTLSLVGRRNLRASAPPPLPLNF